MFSVNFIMFTFANFYSVIHDNLENVVALAGIGAF